MSNNCTTLTVVYQTETFLFELSIRNNVARKPRRQIHIFVSAIVFALLFEMKSKRTFPHFVILSDYPSAMETSWSQLTMPFIT